MAPALTFDNASAQREAFGEIDHSPEKPRVYMIDALHPKAVEHAKTLFDVITHSDSSFVDWQKNASAILMRQSYLRAEDIANCTNLVAIGKHGVGIDRIDQAACSARGIKILNAPGANAIAVAELVLALTMSVARQIPSITSRQLLSPVHKETCSGITLTGKAVGVVGMGNIGLKVAQIFRGAFDAQVVAYDPFMPANAWSEIPHTRVQSVRDMLPVVDVLTLHVPLNADTKDMITYKELASMKRTSIIINASRGGIVNEKDLTQALQDGMLWGAGLDAHEEEPPTKERYGELWNLPNVVSTPHIGAATDDAQLASSMMAIDNLYKYLQSVR